MPMRNFFKLLPLIVPSLLSVGCAQQKMLYAKPGATLEVFKRDKYECAQQSRTSWAGGGTGAVGLGMMIGARSNAEKQAEELFKMCMEARGYSAREVSNEEYEKKNISL
jgi:hypothetical protein